MTRIETKEKLSKKLLLSVGLLALGLCIPAIGEAAEQRCSRYERPSGSDNTVKFELQGPEGEAIQNLAFPTPYYERNICWNTTQGTSRSIELPTGDAVEVTVNSNRTVCTICTPTKTIYIPQGGGCGEEDENDGPWFTVPGGCRHQM